MAFDWGWALVILGAVMILLEVLLGGFAGFDLVLVGSTFVAGGAVGLLLGNPVVGLVTASTLCVAYIAAGRRYLRNRLKPSAKTSSNMDAVIGREAVVQTRIAQHEAGMVRVGDEVWRALPAPGAQSAFEPGAVVSVAGVDGVTLQVR